MHVFTSPELARQHIAQVLEQADRDRRASHVRAARRRRSRPRRTRPWPKAPRSRSSSTSAITPGR
jgi:hypothetical protein